MFIRESDGLCTDNKAAAKLFDTIEQAKEYTKEWRKVSPVDARISLKLSIVEVETKPVIKRVGKEVEVI